MSIEKKIKVLTINWTNEDGSTVKIIRDIEEYTKDRCEYYHCYQVGEPSAENHYRVSSWNITKFYYAWARVIGVKYGTGTIPTIGLIRYIDKIQPDVIHVHCPNFYNINLYYLFNHLKKKKYPVVITNHAEFFYTGNCAYSNECNGYMDGCQHCKKIFDTKHPYLWNRTHYEWKKMKSAFSKADYFRMTVVSNWQMQRIKTSPITKNIPVNLIENGVNTTIFRCRDDVKMKNELIEKKIEYKGVILHVTSNFSDNKADMKGGHFIIDMARQMQDYLFVVAGNKNVSDQCQLSDNMILLGNVIDQNLLSEYYNLANLTILTSKRETFGMACAESLACGTPVVGFKSGGTESIALDEYSEFVEYGDLNTLIETVKVWQGKKASLKSDIEIKAKERYSVERMASEFYEIYQNAMTLA